MRIPYIFAFAIVIWTVVSSCTTGSNVTNDPKVYNLPWRSPSSDELIEIGQLLVQNDITGCGEYHVKEITKNEYVLACTADGKQWRYFTVWPKVDKNIYSVTDEMEKKLTPPY
ncbi:hypothetical protein SAMN05660841_04078 [Sphingobacterium nematocida]|uniref:DUF4377 domain-containing protein n=1 Tax=Sphingobacterium nematocida TaxID=1513896 RepID=A0A1T5GHS6_9SPHI|nr:hypothetical protein [Sphingobacterium nematocida]SKC07968.1 hypothetical protein SAMN05660841_04078 [Sphingobacterium nematocida]